MKIYNNNNRIIKAFNNMITLTQQHFHINFLIIDVVIKIGINLYIKV